jgi:hypothetical protein
VVSVARVSGVGETAVDAAETAELVQVLAERKAAACMRPVMSS